MKDEKLEPSSRTLTEVRLNMTKENGSEENLKEKSCSEQIKSIALFVLFFIALILGVFVFYQIVSASFFNQTNRKTGQSFDYHTLMDQNEKILLEIQKSHRKTETLENILMDFMTNTQRDSAEIKTLISNLQVQVGLVVKESPKTKEVEDGIENEELEETRNIVREEVQSEKDILNLSIPTNATETSKEINVASILDGASVDNDLSSSNNLTSFIGGNQAGYVILDRPYLPIGTAWCSYDQEPILTINLANYSKITAVSYQHAEWEGTIPDETPKEYNVMACIDSECKNKRMIARHCQYLPREDQSGPEQKCLVNSYQNVPLINKVQFVFRKNHGKVEQTCVSLVRVYEDSVPVVKTEKEIKLLKRVAFENKMECADIATGRHNKRWQPTKDCVTLYSKNCCSVCPECCEECQVDDTFNDKHPFLVFLFFLASFFLFIFTCAGMIACCIECGQRRS